MRLDVKVALMCFALIVSGAAPARALTPTPTLPSAIYSYMAESGASSVTASPVYDIQTYPVGADHTVSQGAPGVSYAVSQSIESGPDPFKLAASATALPLATDRSYAVAQATITFRIEAVDPTAPPGATSALHVTALLQSSGQADPSVDNQLGVFGQAAADVTFSLSTGGGDLAPYNFDFSDCHAYLCTAPLTNTVDTTINILTNRAYTVTESVFVQAAVLQDTGLPGGPVALTVTGSADPTFSLTSDYLGSHPGAQLLISPGLEGLVSGAPEPSQWALMLVAVGGLGAVLRRRCAVERA